MTNSTVNVRPELQAPKADNTYGRPLPLAPGGQPGHSALLFKRTKFASEDEWLKCHEFYQCGWAEGLVQGQKLPAAPVATLSEPTRPDLEQLALQFQSILEYWNGSDNDRAVADALEAMCDRAAEGKKMVEALLSTLQTNEKQNA